MRGLMGLLATTVFLLLMCSPMTQAQITPTWSNARCLNQTHLYKWENIETSSGLYTSNTTINCSYGCNSLIDDCEKPYQINQAQLGFGVPAYFILFIGAIICLLWGIKGKHLTVLMFATIFSIVLALQSVALETIFIGTMFMGFVSIFIGISMILAVASIGATLVGAVKIAQDKAKEKNMQMV